MKIFEQSMSLVKNIVNSFKVKKEDGIYKEFNQRKTENAIEADSFIKAFIIGIMELPKVTLEGIGMKIGEYQNHEAFTKQAVSKRLKKGIVLLQEYLSETLERSFQKSLVTKDNRAIGKFENVKLYDASSISLPDNLKDYFRGMGGTNAKSALKIQTCFSSTTKSIETLEICQGTGNDSNYTEIIAQNTKTGELNIFDMGYANAEQFSKIADNGGCYLTRSKTNTIYYDEHGKVVDITEILRTSKGTADIELYIRSKRKKYLKIRLLAVRLPEEKANQKKMKARQISKKTLSSKQLEVLGHVVLITNVPKEKAALEELCELYRVRWQIELLFKSWKQYMKFEEINTVGIDYALCLFYGRLAAAVMIASLYSTANAEFYRTEGRTLSLQRFFKNMVSKLAVFIIETPILSREFNLYICSVIFDVCKQSRTESRKRRTSLENLDLFSFYADLLLSL